MPSEQKVAGRYRLIADHDVVMAAHVAGGRVVYELTVKGATRDMMFVARIDNQDRLVVSATCHVNGSVHVSVFNAGTTSLTAGTRRITILAL